MRTTPLGAGISTGTPGALGVGVTATIARPRGERIAYLDGLKVLLVAVIIAGHGALAYSDLEHAWPYQDVQEVALPHALDIVLGVIVIPAALFSMGLFFLISGLVTPASLARKGAARFARDRLVRLGIPLVAWVVVVWPALVYAVHRAAGETESYWWRFTHASPFLDTGPMWFVEVLLVYSLGYAALSARRDDGGTASIDESPLPGSVLVRLAAGISVTTVLVRVVFPLGSQQPAHPNLWQWPQYFGMFGLGILAGRRGWLQPVPRRLRRGCGVAALAGLLAFALLGVALAVTGTDGDVLFHEHLHWATVTIAAIEGPLAVGAAIWLLAMAQRHLAQPPARLGRALARSAFAAFILQGAVLIALEIALRRVGIPAEIKAVTVALVGTAGSFGLAWLLVTRTPLGRLL